MMIKYRPVLKGIKEKSYKKLNYNVIRIIKRFEN